MENHFDYRQTYGNADSQRKSNQHFDFFDAAAGDLLDLLIEDVHRGFCQNYDKTYHQTEYGKYRLRKTSNFRAEFESDWHKAYFYGNKEYYESKECVCNSDTYLRKFLARKF